MSRLIVTVLLGALWLGCSDSADRPDSSGRSLRIGVDPDYPPFEYVDTSSGQVVGFDIDLMEAICAHQGWTCRFRKSAFERLIVDLVEGKVDAVISAMTITARREALVAFSDPYYLSGRCVVIRADDSTVTHESHLRGRRVGVQVGSTGERLAKSTDGALVFSYTDMGEAFEALQTGQIDAIVDDCPYVRYRAAGREGFRLAIVGIDAEYYGIALRKEDTVRLSGINDALADLIGRGAFEELHLKWFGYPLLDVPAVDSSDTADSRR